MSDKIELIRLCGVLQSNFLFISESESQTQPCHVRMRINIQYDNQMLSHLKQKYLLIHGVI